jgi:hypothetical protein
MAGFSDFDSDSLDSCAFAHVRKPRGDNHGTGPSNERHGVLARSRPLRSRTAQAFLLDPVPSEANTRIMETDTRSPPASVHRQYHNILRGTVYAGFDLELLECWIVALLSSIADAGVVCSRPLVNGQPRNVPKDERVPWLLNLQLPDANVVF